MSKNSIGIKGLGGLPRLAESVAKGPRAFACKSFQPLR
jgi:hypothetical protein